MAPRRVCLVAAASILACQSEAQPRASEAACVTTNAPVLRWESQVDPSGVFAYRVDVTGPLPSNSSVASTGWIFATNEPFPGLHVLDGAGGLAELAAASTYAYIVHEQQWQAAPGKPPVPVPAPVVLVANSTFCTTPGLPSAMDEARKATSATSNFSALWRNTLATVTERVQPSGFVPTSVSGGYGGSTNMFVRDTCAMLIGLLEACGRASGGDSCLATVKRVLNFTLTSIGAAGLGYAPHVMTADANLTRIVSFDMADQTDGTMHLCLAFVSYWRASGDADFASEYFPLLARLLDHYVAPGATLPHPNAPLYYNSTLGLLLNPNLEHSRDGLYWTCYDVLTNSLALEALRGMAALAKSQGDHDHNSAWLNVRAQLLEGIAISLAGPETSNETNGEPIYAELLGEPHSWWPGNNNDWPPGPNVWSWPPALIYGMSFVQQGIVGAFASVFGLASDSAEDAGLDVPRFANTVDTFRRLGSFLWLTDDESFSALVPLTHVNASTHDSGDRAVIVKGRTLLLPPLPPTLYPSASPSTHAPLHLAPFRSRLGICLGDVCKRHPASSYASAVARRGCRNVSFAAR